VRLSCVVTRLWDHADEFNRLDSNLLVSAEAAVDVYIPDLSIYS